MGGNKEDEAKGFSVVPSDRTKGYLHKQKNGEFCLKIRKSFPAVKVVKHWKILPREAVESSLKILKT